jgi:hypothetical protein
MHIESDRLNLLTLFPLLRHQYNAGFCICLQLGSSQKDTRAVARKGWWQGRNQPEMPASPSAFFLSEMGVSLIGESAKYATREYFRSAFCKSEENG